MNPLQLGADPDKIEIEVLRLLPDLPAERVLEVGDRITEIEGVPLRGSNDLIRYAQVRAGTPIRLTIRRVVRADNGEVMRDANAPCNTSGAKVTIELGSAEYLHEANGDVQQISPVQLNREQQAMQIARYFAQRPAGSSSIGPTRSSMEFAWWSPFAPATISSSSIII